MALATKQFNEQKYISDVVKYEVQAYSRDDAIIKAGSVAMPIGTVLGRDTSGDFKPLDPNATTGEQVVAAVLLSPVVVSTLDTDVVILRRHALVADNGLV